MIKFAMEIPTAFLPQWAPLTDLDFVLAHKVLGDQVYADFFRNRPKGRELILDNSMHELGHPLKVKDLLEAANRVRADFVIPPDRLGEVEQNIAWTIETGIAFRHSQTKIAPVMCGRTPEERKEVRSGYAVYPMICLPFREPRADWYHEHLEACIAQTENLWMRIHLLGVNEMSELRLFRHLSEVNHGQVWSVDTAKPIKWGIEGHDLQDMDAGGISLRGAKLSSKDLLDLDMVSGDAFCSITENLAYLKRVCAW
jgi:hypothetical protein